MTSQIWSRGSASGRQTRQNEGKGGKGMERGTGRKSALAERALWRLLHFSSSAPATVGFSASDSVFFSRFEGVDSQLLHPLNFTLMSSVFLFNIRKKDEKEEGNCVIFWCCATGFCLNLRVLLVRGWTSGAEDVAASLKLCCPSLTARKCGIMVIRRTRMQKNNLSSSFSPHDSKWPWFGQTLLDLLGQIFHSLTAT